MLDPHALCGRLTDRRGAGLCDGAQALGVAGVAQQVDSDVGSDRAAPRPATGTGVGVLGWRELGRPAIAAGSGPISDSSPRSSVRLWSSTS